MKNFLLSLAPGFYNRIKKFLSFVFGLWISYKTNAEVRELDYKRFAYTAHLIDIMPQEQKKAHCERMEMTIDQFNHIMATGHATPAQMRTIAQSIEFHGKEENIAEWIESDNGK